MTAPTVTVVGYRRRDALAATTVVAGAVLLWATFHSAKGATAFWVVGYLLAAVWVIGARVTEPVTLGGWRASVIAGGIVAGGAAFVVFYGAYRVARDFPVLSGALRGVAGTADAAHVVPVLALAIVNAVAEELFFRGALFPVVESHHRDPLIWSTAIYAVATAASFNVALILAAVVLGVMLAVLRRWSGGVIAPSIAHMVWSTGMVIAVHR